MNKGPLTKTQLRAFIGNTVIEYHPGNSEVESARHVLEDATISLAGELILESAEGVIYHSNEHVLDKEENGSLSIRNIETGQLLRLLSGEAMDAEIQEEGEREAFDSAGGELSEAEQAALQGDPGVVAEVDKLAVKHVAAESAQGDGAPAPQGTLTQEQVQGELIADSSGQIEMFQDEAKINKCTADIQIAFKSVNVRTDAVGDHATFFSKWSGLMSRLDPDAEFEVVKVNLDNALVHAADLMEDIRHAQGQLRKVKELQQILDDEKAKRPKKGHVHRPAASIVVVNDDADKKEALPAAGEEAAAGEEQPTEQSAGEPDPAFDPDAAEFEGTDQEDDRSDEKEMDDVQAQERAEMIADMTRSGE